VSNNAILLRRGLHLDGAAAAAAAIAEAEAAGARICAFFAESILSCGGQASTLCTRHILPAFPAHEPAHLHLHVNMR